MDEKGEEVDVYTWVRVDADKVIDVPSVHDRDVWYVQVSSIGIM